MGGDGSARSKCGARRRSWVKPLVDLPRGTAGRERFPADHLGLRRAFLYGGAGDGQQEVGMRMEVGQGRQSASKPGGRACPSPLLS